MQPDSIPAVFPWMDTFGLCKALEDPLLWSWVISEKSLGHASEARQDIKRLMKRFSQRGVPRLISIDDDERFGTALADLMRSPRGRSSLERQLKKATNIKCVRQFLAQKIFNFAARDFELFNMETICEEREEGRSYLVPEKLATWLAKCADISEEDQRRLAIIVCAFAILQPEDSTEIYFAMTTSDPVYIRWLGNGRESSPALEIAPTQEITREHDVESTETAKASSNRAKTASANGVSDGTAFDIVANGLEPPAVSSPTCIDLRWLESIANRLSSPFELDRKTSTCEFFLAIEQLHQIATTSKVLAEEFTAKGQEFTQYAQRIQDKLGVAACSPWIAAVPNLEHCFKPTENKPFTEAIEELTLIDEQVGRIVLLHHQLETLFGRLGWRNERASRVTATELAEIVDGLEHLASECQHELSRIGHREDNVASCFDLLKESTPKDALQILLDIDEKLWANVLEFLVGQKPLTENGKRYEYLVQRYDLAGLVLATLWQIRPQSVIRILKECEDIAWRIDRESFLELLGFLRFGQLQDLGLESESLIPAVLELLLAAAVYNNRPAVLEYLDPLVNSSMVSGHCRDVYDQFRVAARSGFLPQAFTEVTASLKGTPNTINEQRKKHRAALLNLIDHPPGLKKNYHLLRVIAQSQFFKDLRPLIERNAAREALAKWRGYGEIASLVDLCVRASGKRHELDSSHWLQTQKYLENFHAELTSWAELHPGSLSWQGGKIVSAVHHLGKSGEPEAEALLHMIRAMGEKISVENVLLKRFGEQSVRTDDGLVVLSWAEELVEPRFELSWPLLVEGDPVPLSAYVTDRLIEALRNEPVEMSAIVGRYLDARQFRAATKAAENDPPLMKTVNDRVNAERDRIKGLFANLLQEAATARLHDEFVDMAMEEIDEQLDSLAFDAAVRSIGELDGFLTEFRKQQDPIHRKLVAFLEAAGEKVAYGESSEQLESRIEQLKKREQDCRIHLGEILRLCESGRLPERLTNRFRKLATEFDHPDSWLNSELSLELSIAIGDAGMYLVNRMRFTVDPTGEPDVLTMTLGEWIAEQIKKSISSGQNEREVGIAQFANIAMEIATPGVPESHVLRMIGAAEIVASGAVAGNPEVAAMDSVAETAQSLVASATGERRGERLQHVTTDVRKWLYPLMLAERRSSGSRADHAQLRTEIRSAKWVSACQMAAAMTQIDQEGGFEGELQTSEVAYAVAHVGRASWDDPRTHEKDLSQVCLALICVEGGAYRHVLPSELTTRLVGWAVARVVHGSDIRLSDRSLPVHLDDALERLLSATEDDRTYLWFSDLLFKASGVKREKAAGSAYLADAIWEGLAGGKEVKRPRANLLALLYRVRRYEAVLFLIRHAAQQRQDEIRFCFESLRMISTQPDALSKAMQRFFALRERAHKQTNTQPWILFFEQMLCSNQPVEIPLECALESDYLGFDEDESGLVEVKLSPSTIDPPQQLVLNLAAAEEKGRPSQTIVLLDEDDLLLGPRVVPVTIPRTLLQDAGDVARIAFQIKGMTVLKRPVDVRGTWELPNSREQLKPIDDYLLRQSWPGATGDPVKSERGFHGRIQEIKNIESYLLDDVRPRSAMIVGQRRIGKTSLLLEMVQQLPPSPGHVCGVYVDVEGLFLPKEKGMMQPALFDCIVSAMETKDQNEPLRREVSESPHDRSAFWRLARGLPKARLADALEGLVQQIDAQTKGKVQRIAFFIDEFDRFVEPMLQGSGDEVHNLMWALRQIVQRSQRISLLLAGSGLQRVFTGDYENAFYGSIDEVELGTFNLGRDKAAIEQTFLPKSLPPGVRDQLCPIDRRDSVISHAHELCGGHPYYLAMLGFASARVSRGHPLTPALLNRVVEKMIRGKVTGSISSTKFYGHIFESLKRLPKQRQLIARIMLAHVSELTTQELPWLLKADAIGASELAGIDQSLRFDLLRTLANEQALESDDRNGRVRIRVPITAAALREDSDRLRHQAALELKSSGESAK